LSPGKWFLIQPAVVSVREALPVNVLDVQFFLEENPEMFSRWEKKTADGSCRYELQTHIIEAALATADHSLDELLRLMRESNETAVYLCGTRLDNDFGFGSNDLCIAFSVLPQDGPKAAEPGHHPGSTEVYVVFQGSLVMELMDRGELIEHSCNQFDVVVIPPGLCHRVIHVPDRLAASCIIKTNPEYKPGVIRCKECNYFKSKENCLMHQSWQREKVSV